MDMSNDDLTLTDNVRHTSAQKENLNRENLLPACAGQGKVDKGVQHCSSLKRKQLTRNSSEALDTMKNLYKRRRPTTSSGFHLALDIDAISPDPTNVDAIAPVCCGTMRHSRDISEVEPFLFISGVSVLANESKLRDAGIKGLLNCAFKENGQAVLPLLAHGHNLKDKYEQLVLCLRDSSDFDALPHFYDAIEFIESHRKRQRPVLVFCKQGISRSATIILAYLMWRYSWTYEKALQTLKLKRPSVDPNLGFLCQLKSSWQKCRPGIAGKGFLIYQIQPVEPILGSHHRREAVARGPLRWESRNQFSQDGTRCYILCPRAGNPGPLFQYIWYDVAVPPNIIKEARRICGQLAAIEGAPEHVKCIVFEQNETEEFAQALRESIVTTLTAGSARMVSSSRQVPMYIS